MNYKDTVLTGKRIIEITEGLEQGCSGVPLYLERLANAQAKVSFEAGIKLVVDWINGNSDELNQYWNSMLYPSFSVKTEDWEAQEWYGRS